MITQLAEQHGLEFAVKQVRRPMALVRMAIAYAKQYSDEIAACLQLHAERDFEGLKRVLPTLERL